VSHTSDYLKDADFQARFPVFSDVWPEHRKHPLNQAMFAHHPQSALRLNMPECPPCRGIETPYFYPKCNSDHFCWHQEQHGLAAWHHCLRGATQWYLVPASHRSKFVEAAQDFVRQCTRIMRDIFPYLPLSSPILPYLPLSSPIGPVLIRCALVPVAFSYDHARSFSSSNKFADRCLNESGRLVL
jgi:hypothetical protein